MIGVVIGAVTVVFVVAGPAAEAWAAEAEDLGVNEAVRAAVLAAEEEDLEVTEAVLAAEVDPVAALVVVAGTRVLS